MITNSICHVCLKEIPAHIEYEGSNVYLCKECPEHGYTKHLIEIDKDFYSKALESDEKFKALNLFATTGIDVTRRCNVQCPHCYVEPDNRVKDKSIESIIDLAKRVKKSESIILMGAEPTVRDDLPELIKRIKQETGKTVGIYTNGIKFASKNLSKELKESGLDYVCVSLHTKEYLQPEELYNLKVEGLLNMIEYQIPIHHVSFSLNTIDDLEGVLADCFRLKNVAGHFRIRSPQTIGTCKDQPFFLSQLYKETIDILTKRGYTPKLIESDNTPYHVSILVDNLVLRLIRWPSLEEIDLNVLDTPPYALFDEEIGEVNLVQSFIMQTAKRNFNGN